MILIFIGSRNIKDYQAIYALMSNTVGIAKVIVTLEDEEGVCETVKLVAKELGIEVHTVSKPEGIPYSNFYWTLLNSYSKTSVIGITVFQSDSQIDEEELGLITLSESYKQLSIMNSDYLFEGYDERAVINRFDYNLSPEDIRLFINGEESTMLYLYMSNVLNSRYRPIGDSQNPGKNSKAYIHCPYNDKTYYEDEIENFVFILCLIHLRARPHLVKYIQGLPGYVLDRGLRPKEIVDELVGKLFYVANNIAYVKDKLNQSEMYKEIKHLI